MNKKLSVVLATFNEEENIGACLESCKDIADEFVVVDGSSSDRTREVAEGFGAKVIKTQNHPNFHINKQKAIEAANGEWILQMDADERVSRQLANEIKYVIKLDENKLEQYQQELPQRSLFLRHQRLIEKRDGEIGTQTGAYTAFFLPRLNYFLGKYLRYGGVYPDGVIRLVKKGKAYLPAKDVHEQMVVNGCVGWLKEPLYHMDSPTFGRYLARNNRYIELIRTQMGKERLEKSVFTLLNYMFVKPVSWFLVTQIRHKGILDGYQGIIFSFFSALRFPRAYWRYINKK